MPSIHIIGSSGVTHHKAMAMLMHGMLVVALLFLTSCGRGAMGAAPPQVAAPEGSLEPSMSERLGQPVLLKALGNGFHMYRLKRPDGSEAILYGSNPRLGESPARPAMVVMTGSGCGSAFARRPDGTVSQGFPGYFLREAGDRYTILVLEKRGVEPLDRGDDGSGLGCTEEYHRHATRAHRVMEQLLLVRALRHWASVDARGVVIVGHSEGTDVVSGVGARAGDMVSHMGFLSGGGPTQMFDFVLMVREKARGQPPEVAEKQMNALMEMFRDVFRHPESMDKKMFGHPYSRWAGFFRDAPIEDLLKIEVPLFVAHGSADTAVPIASADFIEVEFIRRGKTNLTFRRYPGLDHSFRACDPKDEGCKNGGDEMPKVIHDFLKWIKAR